MKKYIIGMLCGVIVLLVIAWGSKYQQWQQEQIQGFYDWNVGTDTISIQTTALVPTGRDYTTVALIPDANKIRVTIPDGWFGVEWRIRILNGSENDVDQIEAYTMYGNDHWTPFVTWAVTQGQQIYTTGYYFADTITDTNMAWYHSGILVNPTNGIARFPMKTFGNKEFLFIASSLTTNHIIYIDYRRW